jgi:hypothetical protein
MGGGERLVAVTGHLYGGLLRVLDVDINGQPIGSPSYLPANQIISEMEIGPAGTLVEKADESEEEIDWTAHEDQPGDITVDEAPGEDEDFISGEGKPNPMLAAVQFKKE